MSECNDCTYCPKKITDKVFLNWIYLLTFGNDDEISLLIQEKFKERETKCSA
ncbi:hypothetical protein [Nitrosopumilus spindle-shaped virus]|uniref:Uncharacterized protein n=1 Tax=Nitrosopumilus spindle-shaped virus TaxID=2508184 RepID=A0A514K358_9VIRU|nr:hypothetical protein [Nitrosopumilus spindle-shaped virus]